MEYNARLLVVDTFNKQIAVVPLNKKTGENLRPALEQAFKQLDKKGRKLYIRMPQQG